MWEDVAQGPAPAGGRSIPAADGVVLGAPYLNPCRGAAAIVFTLPEAADVRLELLDAAGRSVATLAHGAYDGGEHVVALRGLELPGVYFCRLTAGSAVRGQKRLVR